MDIDQLDKLLPITNGILNISATTLPGDGIRQLLVEYNQGAAITISDSNKTVDTIQIIVTGTSPFLHVPVLAVTATFTIDAKGNPQVAFVYTLIGATIPPSHWTFGQSFPDLPPFGNGNGNGGANYLDSLVLSDTSYTLTTSPVPSPLSRATLQPGLSFTSKLAPQGIAGLFDAALGSGDLVLEGPISLPLPGQTYPALPYQTFPWDLPGPTPGIFLTTQLGISVEISSTLKIDDTSLLIYTPASQAWLATNSSYAPLLVLAGTLTIPSLSESVDLYAYVGQATATATIIGLFHNFTFDSLSNLTELAGGDGLLVALPSVIQTEVRKIAIESQLQLDCFSLTLHSGFSGSAVQAASITVGLPGVDWSPVDGFDLGNFSVQFLVVSPFSANRAVTALLKAQMTIAGGLFDVAFQVPDFSIYAQLESDSSIDLTKLFTDHLPSLPAPPALDVNEMTFNANPGGGGVDFFVGMAQNPPWTLSVTPAPITIYNVRAQLSRSSGVTTGQFSGNMDIGKFVELTASYDMPGGFMIRSVFPKIALSEIIGLVSNIGIVLPAGFDFSLGETFILIEGQDGELTFSIGTQVDSFGLLVLTAQELGGKWNFGFGLDVNVAQLGRIPGLGVVKNFTDYVGLEDILLVVAASDVSKFNFPDTASFNAPQLGSKNIQLPSQAGGELSRGLNLYAKINASQNKGFQLFANYCGITLDGSVGATLAISLPDPLTNSKVFLSIDFGINSATSVTGEMGVLLQESNIGVFLTADVKTTLQSYPVEFAVTGVAVESGAFISGSARGVLPKFNITDSLTLQFSNLALEIGIDDAGIPSFGFMGSLDTNSGFDSSIAVFFDSANPAQSLIAGSVSNITLFDVIDTFTEGAADDLPVWLKDVLSTVALKDLNAFTLDASLGTALDNLDFDAVAKAFAAHHITIPTSTQNTFLVVNSVGKIWSLTTMDDAAGITHYQLKANVSGIDVELQAQLYLAPQTTKLGNFNYPQGFKAIGEIEFLFLDVISNTVISPSQGIKIDESVEEIKWELAGILILSLTGADGTGNARLSVCTYSDPSQPDPKLQSPHCLLSGALNFLDLDKAAAYVDIRKDGAEFSINSTCWAVTLGLTGHFTDVLDIAVIGTAAFHLGTLDLGDAGSIHVDSDICATLGLFVSDPEKDPTFTGTATLTIELLSHNFQIVNAGLSVDADFFEHLASSIIKLIVKEVLAAPSVWLGWVEDGLITIELSVAEVLRNAFNINKWEDAAKLMWQADMAFLKIMHQVADAFGVEISAVASYLESMGKNCAIETVNNLTNGSARFNLFAVARDVLVQISPVGDGNRLLYLFYNNKDVLEYTIRKNPDIWHGFAGEPGAPGMLALAPVERVIDSLGRALPLLPRQSRREVTQAIEILDRYRGVSWSEFPLRMNARDD